MNGLPEEDWVMDRLVHRAARLRTYTRKLGALAAREIDSRDTAGLRRLDDELRRALEDIDDMRCEIAAALEEGAAIEDGDRRYFDAMLSLIGKRKG